MPRFLVVEEFDPTFQGHGKPLFRSSEVPGTSSSEVPKFSKKMSECQLWYISLFHGREKNNESANGTVGHPGEFQERA